MSRNPYYFVSCLLLIILMIWTYNTFYDPKLVRKTVLPQSHSEADKKDAQRSKPEATDLNIFKYIEPEMAGSGSFDEELRRYNLFMSSQGVICQSIRHFGGMYMKNKNPPEFDPDGAWYLCLDPEVLLLRSTCVVYSIGINDEWSFDDSIAKYGCKVYAFDPTMNKGDHFRTPTIQFFNLGLSDVNSEGTPGASGKDAWKTRTLRSIIKYLGHGNRSIDVLKIDIEWDEWKCLPQMLADGTLRKYVKQLDVEFHVVDSTPFGIRRYYGISKWLDRQGFKIANMHRNMYCPQCYETTYVNTNFIKLPLR